MKKLPLSLVLVMVITLGTFATVQAAFTTFTDPLLFEATVGSPLDLIDFTGFANGTPLANQYLGQGVAFTDGNDTIHQNAGFLRDGWGVQGGNNYIDILFNDPLSAVGAYFPGALQIEVYDFMGGTLLYDSGPIAQSGLGFFGGVADGTDFTFVRMYDWYLPDVYIDDLVYAKSVPEPSSLLLLGTGLIGLAGFRRKFRS